MEEIKSVNNPHDLYFKATFGKVDFAKEFLNNYLPQELAEIININTLSHEPTSFVNDNLQEQFADLIYKTEIKGKEAYITFLFEHKSYKDRMIIFQVLKYMIAIWEEKIKTDIAKKENKIEIPIIIPIVVYHDKTKWNIKRSLGELMPSFQELPENIKKYIPDYEYLLIDISHLEKDKIKQEEYKIVLETLSKVRHETKEEVIEIFKQAIEIYTKTNNEDIVAYYIIETIVYIISTRDDFSEIELKDIAGKISKKGGELFMTLAERLMEKGMEKGIKQGTQKRNLEIAKNLLAEGAEVALVVKATGLKKSQVEKLKKELNN